VNQKRSVIKIIKSYLTKHKKLSIITIFVVFLILIYSFISIVGIPITASGKIRYIFFEGGMFEFEDNDGNEYNLLGVEEVLSKEEYLLLIENNGTQYKAKMSGWVKYFSYTHQMSGTPVLITSLDISF
jgi:hypothetical protein